MNKSIIDNPSGVLFKLIAGCQRATRFAWGGIGPGSRAGARAIDPARTWLGVLDLRTLDHEDARTLEMWIAENAALLYARNLIMSSPWLPGQGTDLKRTAIMDHAPRGWLDAARPVLLLTPGASIDFYAARKLVAPQPEAVNLSHLWARTFDVELALAIAHLAKEERRAELRS